VYIIFAEMPFSRPNITNYIIENTDVHPGAGLHLNKKGATPAAVVKVKALSSLRYRIGKELSMFIAAQL
jgi:hypothetical protein